MYLIPILFVAAALLRASYADGVNWINPQYVVSYASQSDGSAQNAVRAIVNRARSSAKKGPFTITKGSIVAPSGKKQDYLSWAPYHWPNCNWCKKRAGDPHEQSDSSNDTGSDNSTDTSCFGDASLDDQPDLVDDVTSADGGLIYTIDTMPSLPVQDFQQQLLVKRCHPTSASLPTSATFPSSIPALMQSDQAEGARQPSRTQSANCTPSPTTSMAPSATWTACPYQAKDGRVNPDRNQLYGLPQLIAMSQSTIDNALAAVLDKNPSAAKDAAKFIDSFFLDSNTGVSPNLAWGQTVRGPGQHGSYMGVLDFRVVVKVVNAIQLLRVSKSQYWTSEKDSKMTKWTVAYIQWLESSELGKRAKKSVNNHSTFYYAQMTALKILLGDESAALNTAQAYFAGPFKEQIVSSGEQPFESTRTRPYHYRAFNIEAMLAVAKLGDYLSLNMWNTQTRYRSTIKTAVDYLITLDSGQENPGDALPIVAAALAAYGDDTKGTYKKFLESGGSPNGEGSKPYPYKSKTWWLYEQPGALQHSPGRHKRHAAYDLHEESNPFVHIRQDVMASMFSTVPSEAVGPTQDTDSTIGSMSNLSLSSVRAPSTAMTTQALDEHETSISAQSIEDEDEDAYYHLGDSPVLHPNRPAPFMNTDAVELEEGIFVYWEQIRHLYQTSTSGKHSRWARW